MPKETLEQELEHMFREDLLFACQYWGIDVSGSSSGDSLAILLAERMRDKEAREQLFGTFTEKEVDLLGMLSLSGGAMSYDRLKPYRKIYSYGQLNQTERDLRKKGVIIRRVMSRLTEFGREVAEFKILDFFIPHLRLFFKQKPEPNPEKPKKVRSIVDYRDTMLIDMLLLTSYLGKREVKLTTSWEFPKRDIDNAKEAMSKQTDDRFEIVQKMGRKAGAYKILEDNRLIPGKIDVLFAGKQDEVSKRLLLSSLGRTRAIWATPDQPTEYTLNLVICRLRESTQEDWISVTEMRDWIRSELYIENEPLKWIQVSEERVSMALETPILLGLVEAAYKGKKVLAVKLTSVGETVLAKKTEPEIVDHETFFVQPNFELTVFTSEMDYSKLYQLMRFTEPVKTDVVSSFKITDQSIFQAVEAGLRENQILDFLEQEGSKPVPKNVSRSIKDWTSQTTFATYSDVTLFETETERDLEDLLLIKDFEKYTVRQVGPTAIIIQGDMEQLVEDLRKHKCNVRKRDVSEIEIDSSEGPSVAEQVLLFGEHATTDIPEACLGCPATQSCNRLVRRKNQAKAKT
ncbi:MAG: helicase-associated domain-containing protein [Candidatus Thorarchaeota archaeon]